MKVLFLTDTWFPNMTTNAICVKNISEELVKQGNEVYVCAYGCKEHPKEKDQIKFSYIRPSLARRLLNLAQYKYKSGNRAKLCSLTGTILNRIRRALLLPFYPIVSFYVPLRWLKGFKYINSQNRIDTIVSVIAPDEALYAGYLIKKNNPSVSWIVYYIDAGTNILSGTSFEGLKRQLQKKAIRWENRVLKSADKIIVMEGHSKYYSAILSQQNNLKLHVADVPLLTTYEIPKTNGKEHRDALKWVYTGNMNGKFYDPRLLCEVFIEYCKIRPAELHLYGPSDHSDYLEGVQAQNSTIIWHGTRGHDEVIKAQSQADVLIYFKCEALDSVSGKLFEYLSHGKPVIYIGPDNDINSVRLSKYTYGLALSMGNKPKENAILIDKWLSTVKFDEVLSLSEIESAYTLCLPKTTAKLIAEEQM